MAGTFVGGLALLKWAQPDQEELQRKLRERVGGEKVAARHAERQRQLQLQQQGTGGTGGVGADTGSA